MNKALCGALLQFAVFLLPAAALAAPALSPVEDEVIVKFKADSGTLRKRALAVRADAATVQQVLADRAAALGARVGHTLEAGGVVGERTQVMRGRGIGALALAARLAADPEVEYAVPNGRKRAFTAPNDPLYAAAAPGVRANGPDSGQWYLRKPDATLKSAIDIEVAWARTQGSASVVVAVLDTGVRFDHPDLGRVANGGKLLPGYDFVADSAVGNDGDGRDADPSDPGDWTTAAENSSPSGKFYQCDPAGTGAAVASTSSWHGTTTASLVGAAANSATPTGMAGAAPGVQVLPVRVLGKCFGTDGDIQAAMKWAAGIHVDGVPDNPNPAKVINLSLGGVFPCNAAYKDAVSQVLAQGTVIVAAAGNSNGGAVGEPANCPGVIGVAGLRHAGSKVGYSDLGPEIGIAAPAGNCVDVGAGAACRYPILAATNRGTQGPTTSAWTDSFNYSVGTSFASPLVAAVAALMFSQQPLLTPAQLSTAMKAGARPFPSSGADNGSDPTPVPSCQRVDLAGASGQCYCPNPGDAGYPLCGAGMLDAGAAVTAVAGPLARITITTATPTAGSAVTLSAASSLAAGGAAITAYEWSLISAGGIVSGFSSAINASTATLLPSAAGSFTVQLKVTDNSSPPATAIATQDVTVAAAPVAPTEMPAAVSTGSGGGASSLAWVLGVLLASAVLRLPAATVRSR